MTKYYVTTTDTFMSGWGTAENRVSKFVIVCDSYADAEIVRYNMRKEPCFKNVRICVNKPHYPTNRYHTSFKTFAECSAYNHY